MIDRIGWLFFALFLGSIPFANWYLTEHGLWDLPWLGHVPSAVWVVGFAFVFRDICQITLGRGWAWVGIFLSWFVAAAAIATASAVAFAFSETSDALVFTPLANRGTTRAFLLGVTISGYAASVVDSALFVRIAFHSFDGWWQLTIAKIFFVMLATPIAWLVRQQLKQRRRVAVA